MSYPSDRIYHGEHTWLFMENHEVALIGVTFFAQDTLGDIVEINAPIKGGQISKGVSCGSIESRKTVSDLIAPISGVIIEVNEALNFEPFWINDEPYGRGWIARIKIIDPDEASLLMTSEQYKTSIGD
jgi:glycine cleavage system H protein